jgi:hypothetical protein
MKEQPKSKLRQLLDEAKSNTQPRHTIEHTLTPQQVSRLKPLAWLLERERYTWEEISITALAYHQKRADTDKRAEAILALIRSRQSQPRTKKGKK